MLARVLMTLCLVGEVDCQGTSAEGQEALRAFFGAAQSVGKIPGVTESAMRHARSLYSTVKSKSAPALLLYSFYQTLNHHFENRDWLNQSKELQKTIADMDADHKGRESRLAEQHRNLMLTSESHAQTQLAQISFHAQQQANSIAQWYAANQSVYAQRHGEHLDAAKRQCKEEIEVTERRHQETLAESKRIGDASIRLHEQYATEYGRQYEGNMAVSTRQYADAMTTLARQFAEQIEPWPRQPGSLTRQRPGNDPATSGNPAAPGSTRQPGNCNPATRQPESPDQL